MNPSFCRRRMVQATGAAALLASQIHADALLAYLGRANEAESVKLRNWLEREVVRPAATIRARLGIHDPVPTGTLPTSAVLPKDG